MYWGKQGSWGLHGVLNFLQLPFPLSTMPLVLQGQQFVPLFQLVLGFVPNFDLCFEHPHLVFLDPA